MPVSAAVTTWFLEMLDREQLRPAAAPALGTYAAKVGPDWFVSRWFYNEVGRDWSWTDRLAWTEQQWRQWVERSGYEMWVARSGGAPAGYLELDAHCGGEVEVAYFGLLPGFMGRGLGGHLLTLAAEAAWDRGATRLWVHTCSLDGPHALANYERRGFQVYRQSVGPPGPTMGVRSHR